MAMIFPSTASKTWRDGEDLHLDVRGLPPPQPMVMALEFLDTLDDTRALFLHTPFVPMPLLDEVECRGWAWTIVSEAPGDVVVHLERSPAP